MCGIFGYTGKGLAVADLINGLARLEYRGYDSCGIAAVVDGKVTVKKRIGKIGLLKEELRKELDRKFSLSILHTRWATHGKPNQINSHPHTDCTGKIALVHNGITENHHSLKNQLIKERHVFSSETDTEVVAHLIEKFYRGSLKDAVQKTIARLEGSFALGVICQDEPDTLVAVRKGSPLIVGLDRGQNFIASDVPAILPHTRKAIYLNDEEMAVVRPDSVEIYAFSGRRVKRQPETIKLKADQAEKKGYPHFMLKEIHEQPEVLKKTFSLYCKRGRIHFADLGLADSYLKKAKNIFITACGTAYHAGYVAKYFLEKYCKLDVQIDTSSEFRYRSINVAKGDLLIAISQSGETADTLAAVREFKARGGKVLSVCNCLGSSLVKESHGLIYTLAGPEIGVASTKAYTAQVFSLFLFALRLAKIKKTVGAAELKAMLAELEKIPVCLKEVIEKNPEVRRIARKFSKVGSFLFLGRGVNFPSALEGALKLKEISYIPAEGYPAGEMKHGPIALIDEYRGVVCIAPKGRLYEKMVSNMQETKARKGKILAILNHGDSEASLLADEVVHVPQAACEEFSPLIVAPVLQLFAYHVAHNLGHEIDQPRNLAKSVTVE